MIKVERLSLLKLKPGEHTERDFLGRYHLVKDSAPRGLVFELEQLLNGLTDPALIARIRAILELAKLGWLPQNQPSRSDSDTPKVPENAGSLDSSLMHFVGQTAPGETGYQAKPGNSGNGPNIIDDQLPRPSGVTTHPSAHVNSNTERPRFGSGYSGKKSYRGSLFGKQPNFLLKSYKCKTGLCKTNIEFIASSTSKDSDGDSFTVNQLKRWEHQINTQGLGLTANHDNKIESELGVLTHAKTVCAGQHCELRVSAKLYDNDLARELKERAAQGRVLNFSIAASPNTSNPNWYSKKGDTRYIDDAPLVNIGVVHAGSNPDAKLIAVNN